MMLSRLRGKPIPLRKIQPQLAPQLEVTLMKSLESDKGNRYASARDFGFALAACAEGDERARLERMLQ